jgi:hypothetical protein
MAALGGFYGSIRRVLLYRLTLAKPLFDKGLKKILPRIFNITRPKTKPASLRWVGSREGKRKIKGFRHFPCPGIVKSPLHDRCSRGGAIAAAV